MFKDSSNQLGLLKQQLFKHYCRDSDARALTTAQAAFPCLLLMICVIPNVSNSTKVNWLLFV
jgi:hypothetical protein